MLGIVLGFAGLAVVAPVLWLSADPWLLLPGLMLLLPVTVASVVGRLLAGLVTAAGATAVLLVVVLPSGTQNLGKGFEALTIFCIGSIVVAKGADMVERSRAEAVAAREQLDLVLAGGRVGTWTWDIASGAVHWSPTMEEIYGLAPGTFEETYEAFLALVHPEDRAAVKAAIEQAVEGDAGDAGDAGGGGELHVLHRIVRPDGTMRWTDGHGHTVCDASGRVIGMSGVGTDVTDLHYLQQISDLALTNVTLDGLVDEVLGRLRDLLGVDTARILLFDSEGNRLLVAGTLGFEPESEPLVIPLGAGFSGRIAATKQPFVLHDPSRIDFVSPRLRDLHLRSLAGVPLLAGDRLVGVMHVGSLIPRRFSEGDVDLLQNVASRVALSIERNQFIEHEIASLERSQRLARVTAALARSASTDDVAGQFHSEVIPALEAQSGYVALTGRSGARLHVLAACGFGDGTGPDGESLARSPSVLTAVESGMPVFQEQPRVRGAPSNGTGKTGVASRCDLPLVAEGRTIGVLGLGFEGRRSLPPEDRRFLETNAAILAQALQRVGLHDAEQASRKQFEFLATLNELLSRSLEVDEILTQVTKAAIPWLADWCVVRVPTDSDGTPRVEIAHSDPAKVAWARALQEQYPYDPDAAIGAAAVMRTGVAELYEHVDEALVDAHVEDPELREIMRELGLRSVIVVPLRSRNRVLGTLQLVSAESGRRFGREDLAFAQEIGDRIASALDNAILFESQRDIARTLQQALLPAELPEIPGIDVAVRYWATGAGTEVGGDFYDLFETGDGWALVIGDVSGKGAAAASLTTLARHTLRVAARHETDPAALLGWLNEAVNEHPGDWYCTALTARLERRDAGEGTYELSAATAGHPLPLVYGSDGAIEEFGVPGLPAGLFPQGNATTARRVLGPGDVVIFYTDGVTDLPPPHDLDGSDIVELLAATEAESASELADELGAALAERLPLPERSDDIAIIVLRVDPAPARSGFEIELGPSDSVSRARQDFVSWAERNGVDEADREELAVVFSELVTNAMKASGTSRVKATRQDARVRLKVSNPKHGVPTVPVSLPEDLYSENGRGLHVVQVLCDDVDVRVEDGWSVVTCSRQLPSSS